MKISILTLIFVLLFTISSKAETYCQNVNRTGQVVNAAPLAQTASKYLKRKGVDYKSSPQEISSTMKSYCQRNPHSSVDEATDHLVNILYVASELMK